MKYVTRARPPTQGFLLIEVLVTMAILVVGLLGLAGMQARLQVTETESYQRAQAVLLVDDMVNRISANRINAASYVTTNPLGTGDSQPTQCGGLLGVALDDCEWSNAIKGAAEQLAGSNVGAMLGARGCVDQVGTNPPVYRVTVAWQGLSALEAPALPCASTVSPYPYTNETMRRAIASFVTVANLSTP